MSTSQPATGSAPWPADVIHVNEDGWVLINRGSRDGVAVGLRLLVVGTGIRDLHDLFAPDASSETQRPALRIRRTYELLEVIHAEEHCAVAIATRTPAARRPTVYRGPEGELLVWAPLPEGYTWPPPNSAADDNAATDDESSDDADADAPPERAPQDDEPWEEALPLNSVSVGDIVLPALPATPASPSAPHTPSVGAIGSAPTGAHDSTSPFEQGRTYDWMKKPGE
ncbi:MAG TPA: hypothetical protein VFS83_03175 [Ktedonobacterales bacterium]|nr:hypothetical protein [Ktedonobacterales bacterium]